MTVQAPRFVPFSTSLDPPQSEAKILELWREIGAFENGLKRREGSPEFVFYEGPPTANGLPGVHHVLSRTLKDIFDSAFVGYFMALNLAYTVLLLLGSRQVSEWVRRRPLRDFRGVSASPLSLPVTILAPAYNEEPVIVPSINSLLAELNSE